MKKVICSMILLIVLLACTNEETLPKDKKGKEESQIQQVDRPIIEGNLLEYRPKVGTTRVFKNNEDEIYQQKVLAENEEYIQLTILLSGAPTTQIYRWTDTEITLVYEHSSPADPSKSIVNQFTPMGDLETLINLEMFTADWQLIDIKDEITVPVGRFQDVYVLRMITDEVEGADTIYTRYFAKGTGLIKETFELTGESGYTDEATLSIIE
ncbi:hypothetical protein [Bacillus sp. PS06]|uniref:hypothetical protein n=1 Tax=Bacillus sp. PS06 TaxID=2764176 RepID=UPI001784C43E|nr:hypothetical protein [Bacillus sp. PS06]MBD8070562.1 hypothetical protein [Bacillus sp. PS06]